MRAFVRDGGQPTAFSISLVRPHLVGRMLRSAMAGDRVDGAALTAITGWFRRCPDPRAVNCFGCGDELAAVPPAFIVGIPLRPDPSHGFLGALCPKCSGLPDGEILRASLSVLKGVMPDVRVIDPGMVAMGGSA